MYVINTNLSIADVTAEWNVRFNKILTNSSVVEPSWISWQAHEALSIASRFVFITYIIASTLQVQTKVRKKNIENTYKTDKYMQKLPREKHVEVKYSPWSIFFTVDDW
jgi:hypothetical protein